MHSIHFIRVNATNAQGACDFVESEIADWGTENNWRHICGAVDKEGKALDLTIKKENGWVTGRWTPDLEKAHKLMKQVFNNPDKYHKEAIDKLIACEEELGSHDWWQIGKYAQWKTAKMWADVEGEFDIWKDTFREWEFDETGLTAFDTNKNLDPVFNKFPLDDKGVPIEPEMNKYIVFLDMHS